MNNIKPVITERTLELAKKNWYTFGVPLGKNKNELREFIEKTFKVNVLAVRTMTVKGKSRRSLRSRKMRQLPDWKKVIVLIKEGQKIDLFETGA
ncbi:MAG TPA: 50S ribosomal protein L23 [Patescibacteria group bacterium]|nr:50S ribosomal protein L23 [Patescibacteria group bacterium]